jgi:hypothetical protein
MTERKMPDEPDVRPNEAPPRLWVYIDALRAYADAQRERAAELAAKLEEAEKVKYPAIWLEGFKREWTVKIELDKKWITVIRESHGDGGHSSHIVEPLGIQAAIDAAIEREIK